MPNHLHAILEIVGATLVVAQPNEVAQHNTTAQHDVNIPKKGQLQKGQPQGIAPTGKTIGDMVAAFKSITTVEYIRSVKNKNWQAFDKKSWQRNYWDHIIRNDKSYQNISEYIIHNSLKWNDDKLNPNNAVK